MRSTQNEEVRYYYYHYHLISLLRKNNNIREFESMNSDEIWKGDKPETTQSHLNTHTHIELIKRENNSPNGGRKKKSQAHLVLRKDTERAQDKFTQGSLRLDPGCSSLHKVHHALAAEVHVPSVTRPVPKKLH